MKYYLWVLGCAMNISDAERIAAVLDSLGYQKTKNENEANLIVVVACSVRQTAIDRIYGKVKIWNKRKRKGEKIITILTGCVLEKDRKKMSETFDVILDIEEIGSLPTKLKDIPSVSAKELGKSGDYLKIKPSYESNFRAYVPIMTGCNNFCSYCAVPYTRGREKSRKPEDVIKEVKELVQKGYKEITLLGQNVNSYNPDPKIKNSFEKLLSQIDKIEGDYRVYFYSNHPKDISDELIKILPSLKHFPAYIHLPLQSGNNEILTKMNRHYTKESYLKLVDKIRKAIPNITLTTDIIVGFPGETETQFNDTVNVMKKAKFDMAFIAQYSPRPGALSFKIDDDVLKQVKVQRDKKLVSILAETVLENNKKLLNSKIRVLLDGEKEGKYFGRSKEYKVVEIKTDQILEIGQFYDVKIKKVESWKLFGELI